ncbi:universal stress protein [Blastococcus sp. CCUG 61487]|uniref:universal stress protein n=1 Tax=Blastococcus sp. CCUG 61487 TaxID=1840703 RepID=UPI0010BF6DAC|nr:universal stress protein [Blastococcus sp. CCUG 61487]TKJ20662.1 hypothetical protein A6V29_08440 [Blastococcus sp. CCUG 61487]
MLSDGERRTMRRLEATLLADAEFTRSLRPLAREFERLAAPVVVGLDDEPAAAAALTWAAGEAAALRCPLRVVHAFRSPLVVDPLGVVPTVADIGGPQAAATELVDAALTRARSIAPDVDICASTVRDSPRRLLLRESRTARLLVVGSRRLDARPTTAARLLRRPLTWRLAAAASCPVAVVHPSPTPPTDPRARVVVGVDRLTCADAVGYAFRTAAQRGLPVTAVHAWIPGLPSASRAPRPATSEAAAASLVEDAVCRWRQLYPHVPLRIEVVRRDPVTALVAASVGAALVVVGSRERRPGRAAPSVSRAVVDRAAGPVAVVRARSQARG